MTTQVDIVAEARTWVGTPYRHHGRNKYGLDCCGLIVVVGNKFGLVEYEDMWYGPMPDGVQLIAECNKVFGKPLNRLVAGGVAVMWMSKRNMPQHMGIIVPYRKTELGLVHSYQTFNGVREHRLDEMYQRRIVAVYGYPGVKYDG